MAILEFDREASKRLLAVYTTPDVEQQRSEFLKIINLQIGEKVLDEGTGPGFLARAMVETGKLTQEETEKWANELRSQKEYFFSLNRYLFIATKI